MAIRIISKAIERLRPGHTAAEARAFRDHPASPWLISFPRTGSHWLRMMLEQYADRPLLPRSFFPHSNSNYLLNHSHDYEFALRPQRLIYLYRDPTPTVFSQIRFHGEDPNDAQRVRHWATLYRLHLCHWLCRPHEDRTVVRYEALCDNLVPTFSRVLAMLGLPVDVRRIEEVHAATNHSLVREKTQHDPRVMNSNSNDADVRRAFAERFGAWIDQLVIEEGELHEQFARPHLTARAA